jgi:hypothetical protein
LALVFWEYRRVTLVRREHFGTSIPRDDGVSGVEAEVNKEKCHFRSDFFCAGYNPGSVIGKGDRGGRHCAQGSQGGTHDFWDTNMGN